MLLRGLLPHAQTGAGGNKYGGPLAAAAALLARDGPRGFLKGWAANYARLGPQVSRGSASGLAGMFMVAL